jgi:uncharacterized membrane protein (Fun14 family)
MRFQNVRALLAGVVSACLMTVTMTAQAGVVGTEAMLQQAASEDARATVESYFGREDVQAQLEAWGVTASDAEARVAAMSESELNELAMNIEHAPAGAGVLEVIGITFVVLLVLELLGVINVFAGI